MSKKPNTGGGGAQTNINGLHFEQNTSLEKSLIKAGFYVDNYELFHDETLKSKLGILAPKHNLYKLLLEPKSIHWEKIISKQLLPDEAFYNFNTNTVYIIEKKFQKQAGSVDEKLQTCDFKLQQYTKLFSHLNIKVIYMYILCDWFKDPKYKDVLEYIIESNCKYFFDDLPPGEIGL